MKIYLLTLVLLMTLQIQAAVPRGALDFGSQITIARNDRLPMSARWQALVKAAEVADYQQIALIKEFAKSKEWYMRNATLVALEKININHAYDEAQILLKDKALVVRSAAVDVIASKYSREGRDLLAGELNKSYNFSRKSSLWIRSKIFNIIASKAVVDDRNFFTKYLFDQDEKIVNTAAATLEELTHISFSEKDKVKSWREFVKKNGWL